MFIFPSQFLAYTVIPLPLFAELNKWIFALLLGRSSLINVLPDNQVFLTQVTKFLLRTRIASFFSV